MAWLRIFIFIALTHLLAQQVMAQKKIEYRLSGSSEPERVLVFLNGIDKNLHQWDQVLAFLQPRLRKTAYLQVDLQGQGRTAELNSDRRESIPYEEQLEILIGLFKKLGIQGRSCVVVGHSYGGGIGARLVADYHGLVHKLIMISPFVDHLETYQPGLGPLMWWAKSAADLMGLRLWYETNVQLGSELGTAVNWPAYTYFHNSEAKLANVISLTRGVRDLNMKEAVANPGRTQLSLLVADFDEIVPAAAHAQLWNTIPKENRGLFETMNTSHESVTLNPDLIAKKILEILRKK